jgi:hypothetical protein
MTKNQIPYGFEAIEEYTGHKGLLNKDKINTNQNKYQRSQTARYRELELENAELQDDLGMALDEISRLGGAV